MEIHFVFRASSLDKKRGTIQCRITVNKVRLAVESISRHQILRDHWNVGTQRASGRSKHGEEINLAINRTETKIRELFRQYDSFHRPLTAKQLIQIYRGNVKVRPTIPELIREFLQHKEDTKSSLGTVQTYGFKLRPLVKFLESEGKDQGYADEFDSECLARYRAWLVSTRGAKHRYAAKNCQTVKTMLIWAKSVGKITHNLLHDELIRVDKTPNVVCLTPQEVKKLETALLSPILRQVADCYLFSCYTGLAYQDMRNLTEKSLEVVEGRMCLTGKRQKTGTDYIVPLTAPARGMIKKYGGVQMPLPENRRYNMLLKDVMLCAGIDKHITGHTGRKTFADWCLNEVNMSKEATIVAMGQKDTRELNAYARIRPKRLMAEFPADVD